MRHITELIAESDVLNVVFSLVLTLLAVMVSTLFTYKSKNKMDIFMMKNEGEEIDKAVQKIRFVYKDVGKEHDGEQRNIISMMIDNVSELREYYVISKQQARKAFSAALLACIFGFIIYIFGIVVTVLFETDASIISIIGGTAAEIISALFFWLYRESTKQLSVYHQRLGSTEKYLTVIQLIKDMPKENQIYAYNQLMQSILSDNKEIITREKVDD